MLFTCTTVTNTLAVLLQELVTAQPGILCTRADSDASVVTFELTLAY